MNKETIEKLLEIKEFLKSILELFEESFYEYGYDLVNEKSYVECALNRVNDLLVLK